MKIGTKDIRNGAVTSAKVKNRSLALRDFKRPASLQGKTGAAGPQGIAGPQGPKGPVDAKYWAVYRDGLDRSSPGVSLVAVNPSSIVLQFDSPAEAVCLGGRHWQYGRQSLARHTHGCFLRGCGPQ